MHVYNYSISHRDAIYIRARECCECFVYRPNVPKNEIFFILYTRLNSMLASKSNRKIK